MTASIFHLFGMRGPFAIAWLIVAVIVDAFDRIAFWSCSHINEKTFKFVPAFANLDASTTVVFIIGSVGILAATEHCGPRCVFRCFGSSNRRPMSTARIASTATARNSVAAAKSLAGYKFLSSAIALAEPSNMSVSPFLGCFQHDQTTEVLAGNVSENLLSVAGPLAGKDIFGHARIIA